MDADLPGGFPSSQPETHGPAVEGDRPATDGAFCFAAQALPRPATALAVFVDQIVESRHKYSPLDAQCCGFVSERTITARTAELRKKKEIRAPGKKKAKETHFHFTNARVLARIAGAKQEQLQDDVVAVLFRDSDDLASAGRSEWNEKFDSILHGFQEEQCAKGVAVL